MEIDKALPGNNHTFVETPPELFNRAVWKTRFPSGALEKLGEVTGNFWDFDAVNPYQNLKIEFLFGYWRDMENVVGRFANRG